MPYEKCGTIKVLYSVINTDCGDIYLSLYIIPITFVILFAI